jgi:hypothetical protein
MINGGKSYNPPHEAREELPPVVVFDIWAICGSHRLAAYEYMGIDADVEEIDEDLFVSALDMIGVNYLDEVDCFDKLCEIIYGITDDPDVKTALRDQFQVS